MASAHPRSSRGVTDGNVWYDMNVRHGRSMVDGIFAEIVGQGDDAHT